MDKLQISQFNVDALAGRVTVTAQTANYSVSLYAPVVDGGTSLTNTIKTSALRQLDELRALLEAIPD